MIPAVKLNDSFVYLGKKSVTICHVKISNVILQRDLAAI